MYLHSLLRRLKYSSPRGLIKKEYLMVILGQFSPVFRKNICCGCSLKVTQCLDETVLMSIIAK